MSLLESIQEAASKCILVTGNKEEDEVITHAAIIRATLEFRKEIPARIKDMARKIKEYCDEKNQELESHGTKIQIDFAQYEMNYRAEEDFDEEKFNRSLDEFNQFMEAKRFTQMKIHELRMEGMEKLAEEYGKMKKELDDCIQASIQFLKKNPPVPGITIPVFKLLKAEGISF